MKTARTATARQIQFHATNLGFDGAKALQQQILRYVAGTPGKPQIRPKAEAAIIRYFRATAPEFIREQLLTMLHDDRLDFDLNTKGRWYVKGKNNG